MCGRCKKQADGFMDSVEELCEEVETVRGFCYLGDGVNAGGGCEAAVYGDKPASKLDRQRRLRERGKKKLSIILQAKLQWASKQTQSNHKELTAKLNLIPSIHIVLILTSTKFHGSPSQFRKSLPET